MAKRKAGIEYNVKWLNYDDASDNTWEYKTDLKTKAVKSLIQKFEDEDVDTNEPSLEENVVNEHLEVLAEIVEDTNSES